VYAQRLSGPLLDRVDLRLFVPRLTKAELMGSEAAERSEAVRGRVEQARDRQRRRLAGTPWPCNAQVPGPVARRQTELADGARDALAGAVDGLGLTGRGFDRAVRVARTIADLAGSARVEATHVGEALGYRATAAEGEVAAVG